MNISQVIFVIMSVSITAIFTGCSLDSADATGGVTIRSLTFGREASLGPGPEFAFDFQRLGTLMLFHAASEVYGTEPWISDGTPSGTMRLRDIAPGTLSSYSGVSNDVGFTVLGNHAYFAADDFVHGLELWTTDGTTEGTQLFAEFVPGSDGIHFIEEAAVAGNKMFITIRSRIDGTDFADMWVIEDHDLEP